MPGRAADILTKKGAPAGVPFLLKHMKRRKRMNEKIRVAVLFGGKSAEHEVSLQSAKNVIHAMDREKYEVSLIGIDKNGRWHLHDPVNFLNNSDNPEMIALNTSGGSEVPGVVSWGDPLQQPGGTSLHRIMEPVDVVFPVLHGPCGEDGTVQGLLKMMDIPFVGAGVLGSAIGMDKDVMKRLLLLAGVPQAKFMVVTRGERIRMDYRRVLDEIGSPCFIKPAGLGSSVGVSKVHDEEEFFRGADEAFRYDLKILIEENISGREIECSVLGNDDPLASLPGEVITDKRKHQFYSYGAKYIDEEGADLRIPADLPGDLVRTVQELSVRAFKVLCCQGMARVDFFLTEDRQVLVNEINTIPGFTRFSMYPKLWEASGIPYPELIDRLIRLALERHEGERGLETSFI